MDKRSIFLIILVYKVVAFVLKRLTMVKQFLFYFGALC